MSRIRWRRGTAASWTSANPTLLLGEPGFETDTYKLKVGDGATAWNSLGYYATVGSSISETLIDAKGDLIVGAANDDPDRLAVSVTDGHVLTVDAAQTLGVKWAAPAGGTPSGSAGGVLDGTYPSPGLAAGVAGAGLAETTDVLSVNVDGSTLEISSDALRVKDGGITIAKLSFDPATQAELDAHTGDTSAAHAASAVSADSTTLVGVGTDVQAVLAELDDGIADHLADGTAAHAASAISADSTTLVGVGTDVQAVLEELDDGVAAAALASRTLTAGDGLSGGGTLAADRTFTVNVDGSTIETNADALRVKDGGITVAKLSFDPATQAELDAHTGDTSAAHAASAISADSATLVGVGTDVQAVLEELDDGVAASVPKSLYDANTVLKADSDDTPAALTMGASTILARLAAGNIVAATPAELRTLLALVIGTNVQAWDTDLDAVAALTPTNDDVLQRKSGAWTNRTQAQLIADLAALGTTFQPLDSDLTAIAALTTTAYGRAFLALADAAAARTALVLGTAAQNATGDFALTGDARLSDTRPSQYDTTVDLTIPDNSMLIVDGFYEIGATQITELTGTDGVLFVSSDAHTRVFDFGVDTSGGYLELKSS